MKLSAPQKAHETLIECAHQGLIAAQSRDERRAYSDQLLRLLSERDPKVTLHLEQQRLKRVGL